MNRIYTPLAIVIFLLVLGGGMLIQHSWRSLLRGEAMYDQGSRRETITAVIANTILGLILISGGVWLTISYLVPAIVSQW